jgi:hypothetical protein
MRANSGLAIALILAGLGLRFRMVLAWGNALGDQGFALRLGKALEGGGKGVLLGWVLVVLLGLGVVLLGLRLGWEFVVGDGLGLGCWDGLGLGFEWGVIEGDGLGLGCWGGMGLETGILLGILTGLLQWNIVIVMGTKSAGWEKLLRVAIILFLKILGIMYTWDLLWESTWIWLVDLD